MAGAVRGDAVVRIVASAALLLYLCAAWGNGLDRLSTASPALERLVPGPLRAQADRSAAAIALARGDSAAALVFARHAVLHDPVDPLSNSLLGSALQFRGDPSRAEAAFRVAAERGWRDRLTQLYWYGVALEAGDAERAALRADALLRAEPFFAASGALLEPLEASAEGRAALARRLAGNPDWAAAYLTVDPEAGAAQLRLKSGIALLAANDGGALDCKAARPLVTVLIQRGMRRDAEGLWRGTCSGGAAAGAAGYGLADGGFEQLGAESAASPFGWSKHASGDMLVEITDAGVGHALSLRNSASVSRLALSQALALAPGAYRVRAKIGADGAGESGVVVSLDCGAHPRRPPDVRGDIARSGQMLSVGSCDSQVLGVWLRPGGAVTIDDFVIEPVR